MSGALKVFVAHPNFLAAISSLFTYSIRWHFQILSKKIKYITSCPATGQANLSNPPCRISDSDLKFFVRHLQRLRMTDLLKVWEIPQIREITALLRLYGIDIAVVAIEQNTCTIWLVSQDQRRSCRIQFGIPLYELHLRQLEVLRHSTNFRFRQFDQSRPSATGGASLTFVKDRHGPANEKVPRRRFQQRL